MWIYWLQPHVRADWHFLCASVSTERQCTELGGTAFLRMGMVAVTHAIDATPFAPSDPTIAAPIEHLSHCLEKVFFYALASFKEKKRKSTSVYLICSY